MLDDFRINYFHDMGVDPFAYYFYFPEHIAAVNMRLWRVICQGVSASNSFPLVVFASHRESAVRTGYVVQHLLSATIF